nr:glutamate receptor ionotropic, kainate 5-like [Penaeus vannamei]
MSPLFKWPSYSRLDPPRGPAIEIMKIILDKLNMCYEFVVPADGLWGTPFPNGSWSGMMGMLQRKEVDAAVGPFAITLARASVADFSAPILVDENVPFFLRPKIEPDLFGFTKPFTLSVWFAIFSSMFVVTASDLVLQTLGGNSCIWVLLIQGPNVFRICRFERQRNISGSKATKNQRSWLWGFMVLLGQDRLGKVSVRTVFALWMLTAFIIATVYKSNLKAMLIVPKVQVPFDSLEEMVEQRAIQWIIVKGSIVQSFFEHLLARQAAYNRDPTSVMGRGWARRHGVVAGPEIYWNYMISGYAGLLVRYSAIYRLSQDFDQTGKCRLTMARKGFLPVTYSFGFPKDSPLKEHIDPLLKEFGLIDKFLKEDTSNATQCLKFPGTEKNSDLRPLALGDFYGVFCLYAVAKKHVQKQSSKFGLVLEFKAVHTNTQQNLRRHIVLKVEIGCPLHLTTKKLSDWFPPACASDSSNIFGFVKAKPGASLAGAGQYKLTVRVVNINCNQHVQQYPNWHVKESDTTFSCSSSDDTVTGNPGNVVNSNT